MPVFLLMRGPVGLGGSIPGQPHHHHLSAMRKPLGRWECPPTNAASQPGHAGTDPACGPCRFSPPEKCQMAIPIAQSMAYLPTKLVSFRGKYR